MKQKIIAMVQRSPGIKTGQIADQLDVSFEEAQALLAQLTNDGMLKGGLEALVGGGKVMSYELTETGARLAPVVPASKRFLPDGTKAAPTTAPVAPSTGSEAPEPSAGTKPRRVYRRNTDGAKTHTASADVGEMRCCKWSDGQLEVQVGGRTVITFNADGQKMLMKALNS